MKSLRFRCAAVLCAFAAAAVLVCTSGQSVLSQKNTSKSKAGAGARAAATESLPGFDISSIDRSASACTDFNQFANGGWVAKNPIPPAYSRWGRFEQLSDQNQEALHQILEGLAKQKNLKAGDTNPANRMLTGPDEIYVIGSRMMSDELADKNVAVNSAYLNLKYNYHYDEPNDPERLFYRSDHFNYAKHGVPIIFFFDGVHEDYHRPTDSPDKIDYQKMQSVARTIFILASELANAPSRPVVDKQIPAEQMAR